MKFFTEHPVLTALIFAAMFATIVDTLRVGSSLRAAGRQLKNKLSERSVARLRKRIAQLETWRNTINSYASSDKALYLNMFRTVLVILICMCGGAIASILSLLQPNQGNLLPIVLMFVLPILIALSGLKIAALDSRSKISALVAELDSEIADLKRKLNARTEN
jgi:hypothetical protein